MKNDWHRNRICSALRVGACAILLLSLLGMDFAHSASAQDKLVHRQAPRFVRRDLSGKQVDLDAYRGKVVVLNFWATWCAPCQMEVPRFAAWQRKYGPDGLQILGVSMDDDPDVARRVSSRLGVNYPVVMGDARLGLLYGGILGLPVTYLIDRNGKVSARFQGETDLKKMESKIKELLHSR
jgi:thiol-disulfide isomerase/thioredoxin